MWMGALLMCTIGTEVDYTNCIPVTSPITVESEELCVQMVNSFISYSVQFQELISVYDVVDIKCFPFLGAEKENKEPL